MALIRWIHPEYGFMSPGQFIPLFEKNGFISKVDAYVLKRVCEDLSRWQKDGITVVPISINVSRRDYFVDGWFDNQLKTIDSYKIDHNLIHLEVTESLYCEQTDLIIQQVSKAQNLGYKIEMDDFGSGYSSLGMLATFPLDVRKAKGLPCDWQTGMDVFRWWMEDDNVNGQLSMDDLMEDNNA